jgi:DNA-binding transcriptional MocR family regulator
VRIFLDSCALPIDLSALPDGLYARIAAEILTGGLPAGSKLPSFSHLVREVPSARSTIQRHVQQLQAEGYIVQSQDRQHRTVRVGRAVPTTTTEAIQDLVATQFDQVRSVEALILLVRHYWRELEVHSVPGTAIVEGDTPHLDSAPHYWEDEDE